MSIETPAFLRNYVSAITDQQAALFVGAGLSRPAGFVDWRGLLRECALELQLDLDREHDLVAVAQYYLNRRHRDRSRLNQLLKDEFDKPAAVTRNHEIIARLPIETVWTTNFDALLEHAYTAAGRTPDVKVRDRDFSLARKGRDVVIYKMHGDIARPDEIVICKQDYERYAKEHPVFQNALEGDLINKTFLFLGFSFSDPNLDYMLGHLDALLEGSKREHYALLRRARLDWHRNKQDAEQLFEYESNRQQLQIQDLQRYSIQTVLFDEYSSVTALLGAIERRLYLRNVFVSGSAHEAGAFGDARLRDLCMHLGEKLVERDYRIVCGMGLNVGDAVVKGALVRMFEMGDAPMERRLSLSPFPRNLPENVSEAAFNRSYREGMIGRAGLAIFIAGTSRTSPESRGVLEEFEIVRALRRVPIPIGATGFAARRIWEVVSADLEGTFGGAVPRALFDRLNDPGLGNEALLETVFDVMTRVDQSIGASVEAPVDRASGTSRKVASPRGSSAGG